jgi:hypothetical protein
MEKQSFLTKEKHKSYWQRIKETDPEKFEELKKDHARRSKAYRALLTGEKKQREKELADLRRRRFVERKNKTKETNKSYWQRIKETDPGKYEKLKRDQARRNKAYRASVKGEKKRREKELEEKTNSRGTQTTTGGVGGIGLTLTVQVMDGWIVISDMAETRDVLSNLKK